MSARWWVGDWGQATNTGLGLSGVSRISAGDDHTCARLIDRTMRCWGYNANGRLGDGTTTDRHAAVTVQGLSDAEGISAGSDHTCACSNDGTLRCWGYNRYGQIGDGTTNQRLAPVRVLGLPESAATG